MPKSSGFIALMCYALGIGTAFVISPIIPADFQSSDYQRGFKDGDKNRLVNMQEEIGQAYERGIEDERKRHDGYVPTE